MKTKYTYFRWGTAVDYKGKFDGFIFSDPIKVKMESFERDGVIKRGKKKIPCIDTVWKLPYGTSAITIKDKCLDNLKEKLKKKYPKHKRCGICYIDGNKGVMK